MPKFILKINTDKDEIYHDDNIICYIIDSSLAAKTIEKCRQNNKMILLCGNDSAALCKSQDLDGIIFEIDCTQPLKAQVKKQQAIIGNNKTLGLIIPIRRHEAMLAAETEPDFIAFKPTKEQDISANETINWYNELFLIQSAIDLSDNIHKIDNISTDYVIINSVDYKDFSC